MGDIRQHAWQHRDDLTMLDWKAICERQDSSILPPHPINQSRFWMGQATMKNLTEPVAIGIVFALMIAVAILIAHRIHLLWLALALMVAVFLIWRIWLRRHGWRTRKSD